MDKFRLWLGERLAGYREWIGERDPLRFELVMLACVILGITVILVTAFLPVLGSFSAGRPAPRSVSASETVTVVDDTATRALRDHVAELVEPVYAADPAALKQATDDLTAFLATVADERTGLSGSVAGSPAVAAAVGRLRGRAPDIVDSETLVHLLTVDAATYDLVLTQAAGTLQAVFSDPITQATLPAAQQRARTLASTLSNSPSTATAVYQVAAGFVRPNQIVDQQQTLARREAARAEVAPVTVTVHDGEQIMSEGEVVTEQDLAVLRALGVAQARWGWWIWLGIFLIAALEGIAFSRLLHRFNKSTGLENIMLLALVTLLLFFTLLARLLIIHPLSAYLIPVAALGMIVTIILNARSAFLMVVLLSLNVGLLTDLDMRYSLVAIITGVFSVYLVTRVVQRVALLGAGAATMVLAAFTTFSVEIFREETVGGALRMAAWGLAHGGLAWVLTVMLLLLLDTVFNLNTPLRLLELANPAHPLLKRLLQVAPGTYNHSIMMGNLAEAAAEVIDADPLLARVGAYYHDIGKTIRPEYFVENQIYVDNPHDRLSPNLSKLAIAAHVRDGEHLAKLYGLPAPVVDIIRQHHGTTIMAFFYHKARQSSKAHVDEENYRYEEEKPRSKEAAIIMLADGTEAAVRALPNPTRRKIQGVIQEVFKQKIEDGQLDESELTLADLHKIREAFDVTLRGMLGHRIRYPGPAEQPGAAAPGAAAAPIAMPVTPGTAADGAPAGIEQAVGAAEAPRVGTAAVTADGDTPAAAVTPPVPAGRPRVPPSAAALRARRTAAARAAAAPAGPQPPSADEQDEDPDRRSP